MKTAKGVYTAVSATAGCGSALALGKASRKAKCCSTINARKASHACTQKPQRAVHTHVGQILTSTCSWHACVRRPLPRSAWGVGLSLVLQHSRRSQTGRKRPWNRAVNTLEAQRTSLCARHRKPSQSHHNQLKLRTGSALCQRVQWLVLLQVCGLCK